MVRQVDEDAVAAARAMRGYEKRRERIALEEKQGTINILDAASSELTGLGLKAKVPQQCTNQFCGVSPPAVES